MHRARVDLLACAGLALLVGCSSPAARPSHAPAPDAIAPASPALVRPEFGGWVLAPEAPAGTEVRTVADGSRLFISRGTRWIDHPDGSTERSRQTFQEDDVKALELPRHLGTGFVFYVTSGSGTLLWRAETWTGDALPIGRVEPPVSEIIPGFDRLYLTSATSYALRAIDPASGKALDLSPLPPSPAYGDMTFADAWNAVVLTTVRGPLASFDAGESWHPVTLPAQVTGLERLLDGGIALNTERGRFELGPTGSVSPLAARGSDAAFRGTNTFSDYTPDAFAAAGVSQVEPAGAASSPLLGRRPLRSAVLRGWPDSSGTAVVIDEGAVGRVRLADGKLLSARAFAGEGPCRGVALGDGFGFVCGDARSRTEIYAYADETPELVLSLDGPRPVRSSGNGALVIAAGCEAAQGRAGGDRTGGGRAGQGGDRGRSAPAPTSGSTQYCIREVSGQLFDVRVRGDVGSERLAALRDGRVVVLIPPRSNAPGRLSLISRAGTTTQQLSIEPDSGAAARLVRSAPRRRRC